MYEVNVKVSVAQLCPTICNPMDCSLPGSSAHGTLQARILEWVAIPFSRGSSWSWDQTQASCIAGRVSTIWATREAFEVRVEFLFCIWLIVPVPLVEKIIILLWIFLIYLPKLDGTCVCFFLDALFYSIDKYVSFILNHIILILCNRPKSVSISLPIFLFFFQTCFDYFNYFTLSHINLKSSFQFLCSHYGKQYGSSSEN